MPVVVHDVVSPFLRFWAEVRDLPLEAQVEAWSALYERHPAIGNDVSRRGQVPDPRRALSAYPALIDRIEANAVGIEEWIRESHTLVVAALELAEHSVVAYAIVGLAGSNGWAADHDGTNALFLAVERIADETCGRILAAHELTHVLHAAAMGDRNPDDAPLGFMVFAEGLATALTAELMPEYSAEQHLLFGETDPVWAAACDDALPAARVEVRAKARSFADEDMVAYLLIRGAGSVPPDRIGYVLGAQAVGELHRIYSWAEMVRWDSDEAVDRLVEVLRERG